MWNDHLSPHYISSHMKRKNLIYHSTYWLSLGSTFTYVVNTVHITFHLFPSSYNLLRFTFNCPLKFKFITNNTITGADFDKTIQLIFPKLLQCSFFCNLLFKLFYIFFFYRANSFVTLNFQYTSIHLFRYSCACKPFVCVHSLTASLAIKIQKI